MLICQFCEHSEHATNPEEKCPICGCYPYPHELSIRVDPEKADPSEIYGGHKICHNDNRPLQYRLTAKQYWTGLRGSNATGSYVVDGPSYLEEKSKKIICELTRREHSLYSAWCHEHNDDLADRELPEEIERLGRRIDRMKMLRQRAVASRNYYQYCDWCGEYTPVCHCGDAGCSEHRNCPPQKAFKDARQAEWEKNHAKGS